MPASTELLQALDAWRVFESMPLPGQRTPLYVPFEHLSGVECERQLTDAVVDIRRVAVVGPVGSGKSSLIEYVFSQTSEPLAPLLVSAAHEGVTTLTDPTEFARHVIRQTVRWADEVGAMDAEEQHAALTSTALRYGASSASASYSVGVKLAAKWIEPSWSREVVNTLADPEVERSRAEFVESLSRLVELIYGWGRTPVLIIDDFDIWVNVAANGDQASLDAFFVHTCRMLSERNWGIVLSVQPEFCGLASFRDARAQGFLNDQVELPHLSPSSLRRILDERISYAAESADEQAQVEGSDVRLAPANSADVFDEGFEEFLFTGYRRDWNIRPVLRIAESALRASVGSGESTISVGVLRDAMLNG
jgi:hypothetical protein